MSGFLLDTSVVSETIKSQPDDKVLAWLDKCENDLLYLSVVTLGEMRKGIDSLPQPARRAILESWLNHDLALRFAGRILTVDQDVADRWGRVAAKALLSGHPLPIIDSLLAATAMQHNLTFVTRNAKDVAASGVPAFNPWDS